jgi:Flp pilus assembly protein TadD
MPPRIAAPRSKGHTMSTHLAPFLVLSLAIAGCAGSGHGKYTQQSLDEAQLRYAKLKAATEYDMAYQQFQTGNLQLALSSIDRSLEKYDKVPAAHVLKGRILLEQGLSAPAFESFDAAAKIAPDDPEIDYFRGILYERIGELEPALSRYQAAFARQIGNPKYGLATAEVMIQLGRYAEARLLLESGRGDSASHAGYAQALGHIDLVEDKIEDAEHHFMQAVALDPTDPSLLEDLARVQAQRGKFSEAEANLAKALATPPCEGRRDLMLLRAACLIEVRKPVEARTLLLELVKDEKQTVEVETLVKMVDCGAMLEDDSLLRYASQRLLALAPERAEGYLALAITQRRSGDLKEALANVEKALTKKPDDKAAAGLKVLIERQIAKS